MSPDELRAQANDRRRGAEPLIAVNFAQPPDSFAPLIERAPELTREAIMQVFETAARNIELAADAHMQMAIERVAEAKETARTMREIGTAHAATVERAANFAKDGAQLFKSHQQAVTAFRAETGAGSA